MGKHRSKKGREKLFERIFIGVIALVAILVVAMAVMALTSPKNDAAGGYVISEDGHVHDAAGNHIGDLADMIADGTLTVTSDGHVHDAAGNHVGDVAVSEPEASDEPVPTDEPAVE